MIIEEMCGGFEHAPPLTVGVRAPGNTGKRKVSSFVPAHYERRCSVHDELQGFVR